MDIKKLVKRVELTDPEINKAFDDAFEVPINFDHKPTPEDIILVRLRAVANDATNKVLDDPALAMIDREGEYENENWHKSEREYEAYQAGKNDVRATIIPLREVNAKTPYKES